MSHEMLSTALDGECSPEELDRLLAEMERDPALKQAWSRLCLSSEASHGARVAREQRCICDGVMTALAEDASPSNKVVPLIARRRPAYWKPMAGLAAAASVAAVALLGFNFSSPTDSADGLPAGSLGTITASNADASAYQSGWNSISGEDARQLDSYLVDHANYRAVSGMGDTLGYARFAAHTAAYRPDGR